jgi:hypothetical protein
MPVLNNLFYLFMVQLTLLLATVIISINVKGDK